MLNTRVPGYAQYAGQGNAMSTCLEARPHVLEVQSRCSLDSAHAARLASCAASALLGRAWRADTLGR